MVGAGGRSRAGGSCGRPRGAQSREAFHVEGRAREDEEPFDVGQPAEFDLAEARDGFDPAEDPFDPRATGLTLLVAIVPRGARVESTPAGALHVLTDVGRDAERPGPGDKLAGVLVLVGPQGAPGTDTVRA